jgi:polyisoprenoid-binding protein YceI
MDIQTLAVVVVGLFVLLVIFLSLRRSRIKGGMKALGTEFTFEGSNDQPAPNPGVNVTGTKSLAGGLKAADRTGRGANVKDVETYGDIEVTSDPSPKDSPPA